MELIHILNIYIYTHPHVYVQLTVLRTMEYKKEEQFSDMDY